MPVITLTTEWSADDYYIGAFKGALISKLNDCKIVDITHNIKPFNITQAAFILRSCYKLFPAGSIHVICVNSEQNDKNKLVAFKQHDHYFVCSDNGIIGLLFDTKPEIIVRLTEDVEYSTFPELLYFPSAIISIYQGKELIEIGEDQNGINRQIGYLPTIDNLDDDIVITGKVIYIDSYDNAITNISKEFFFKVGTDKNFTIYPQSNYYSTKKINSGYFDAEDGDLLAVFNSLNLLEIAIKNGSAKKFLKLEVGSNIRIKFS